MGKEGGEGGEGGGGGEARKNIFPTDN